MTKEVCRTGVNAAKERLESSIALVSGRKLLKKNSRMRVPSA